MGCLTMCVAILAVLVGLTVSGFLQRVGFFKGIEFVASEGLGMYDAVGLIPAFERGKFDWKFRYEDMPNDALNGKVALVTGGNIGLGFATAFHLAEKGATVVLACRTRSKCEQASKEIPGKVVPMIVDLASIESVDKFSLEFLEKFDRLDIFVQNGGLSYTTGELTDDGIELLFHTNHLGHFAMTIRFEELMKATAKKHGPVQISAVSSAAHYQIPSGMPLFESLEILNSNFAKYGTFSYYAASKLANILFMQSLAERYADANIFANAAAPGLTWSNITAKPKAALREAIAGFPEIVRKVVSPLAEFAISVVNVVEENVCWTSDEGAISQFYAAASPDIAKEKISGQFFQPQARLCPVSKLAQGESGKALRVRLWQFSEELLKERGFKL